MEKSTHVLIGHSKLLVALDCVTFLVKFYAVFFIDSYFEIDEKSANYYLTDLICVPTAGKMEHFFSHK